MKVDYLDFRLKNDEDENKYDKYIKQYEESIKGYYDYINEIHKVSNMSSIDNEIYDLKKKMEHFYNNDKDDKRSTGRTTRIVDSTIQYMFKHPTEWVSFIDHLDNENGNKLVYLIIKQRLKLEHNLDLEHNTVDKNMYRIKF